MSARKDLQILRALEASAEPLSVEDLAQQTGLHWQTVASLVSIMDRDGWMERHPASTTLRWWVITDKGKAALVKAEGGR